jgi:hypothetical protein
LAAFLLLSSLGARCGPGSIVVTPRLPEVPLVDEAGRVDRDAFDAVVAATEAARGLGFIQHPTLELLSDDDPRRPAIRKAAGALEPCPRSDGAHGASAAAESSGGCFADPGFERVVCAPPLNAGSLRQALGRLIDAQNYPLLARAAPNLAGDPGVGLRSLLAASAFRASASGRPATGAADTEGLLDLPQIEIERSATPAGLCLALAAVFLSTQSDAEGPFRAPPLSTKQIASPAAYRASERPHLLLGDAPATEGCTVVHDESVGVARLLVELAAKGGSVPGEALAGWQGDRGIRFECPNAESQWIYTAELEEAAAAATFAREIQRLLPASLSGSSAVEQIGTRVVVSHGFSRGRARAWAASLVTKELARLDELD